MHVNSEVSIIFGFIDLCLVCAFSLKYIKGFHYRSVHVSSSTILTQGSTLNLTSRLEY